MHSRFAENGLPRLDLCQIFWINFLNKIGSLFYNRHCENSLMIFIELHMQQNTPTFYMAINLIFMIVSPINVETTFFVLKFVISLLKLKNNDLIPFFGAV